MMTSALQEATAVEPPQNQPSKNGSAKLYVQREGDALVFHFPSGNILQYSKGNIDHVQACAAHNCFVVLRSSGPYRGAPYSTWKTIISENECEKDYTSTDIRTLFPGADGSDISDQWVDVRKPEEL